MHTFEIQISDSSRYLKTQGFHPELGMFLSPDNLLHNPTQSQNFNHYSYCLNNPLKFTDPSGWKMARADEYWNLGKEVTNYDRFYGFSPGGDNGRADGGAYKLK